MFTLITCNLRCDVPSDGKNYFFNRKDRLVERLLDERPDVIGFQEMTPRMREALTEAFSDYALVGSARGHDLKGECNCVAYKRNRLELHETHTLWLSPTPDVPGSRYAGQSDCPRVVTTARLFEPGSGARFTVYNTHLDHVSRSAREQGLRLVLSMAEADDRALPMPRFIMGDFNFAPQDPEYLLIADSAFDDATSFLPGTWHGFGTVEPVKIDYILLNPSAARGDVKTMNLHECRDGVYLSDHDPVVARWTQP